MNIFYHNYNNMILRIIHISILFILYSQYIYSQIEFDITNKDLGTINSNGDIYKIEYSFINKNKKPVAISHISTSCGCAVPVYDKKPIPANGNGKISISFNPVGIEGFFNKHISVYFSGEAEPVRLSFKGKVSVNTKFKEGYNYNIGEIQFRNIRTTIKTYSSNTGMRVIPMTNVSNNDIQVIMKTDIKGIFFDENEFTLKSKSDKDLNIYYNSNGNNSIRIRIIDGGKENKKVVLLLVEDK